MIPASYLARWQHSAAGMQAGARQLPGLEDLPRGLTGTVAAIAAWLFLLASV